MKAVVVAIWTLLALAIAGTAGCAYYAVPVAGYPATPASFDRSWSAAVGALADQGVQITSEDRGAGQIRGTRSGINVVANVTTQADGSVRVAFNTSGATDRDPQLIQRISDSYDRRMGR